MQAVHFHEPNSSAVVYPTHDGGVVTRGEVGDDGRFPRVPWSVAAVLNILDLISANDSANDRCLPVVIRGNQSPGTIMQFQCRIGHCIWNSVLIELRTNRTQNHPLGLSSLYNETANHHVIARLHKRA